jgi:hypothetical protein
LSSDTIFLSLSLSQPHLEFSFISCHEVAIVPVNTTPLFPTPHAQFEISTYDGLETSMQFTPLRPMITFVSPLLRSKHESTQCSPVGSTKPPSSSLQYFAEKHSSGVLSVDRVSKCKAVRSLGVMHVFSSAYTRLLAVVQSSFEMQYPLVGLSVALSPTPLHPLPYTH